MPPAGPPGVRHNLQRADGRRVLEGVRVSVHLLPGPAQRHHPADHRLCDRRCGLADDPFGASREPAGGRA